MKIYVLDHNTSEACLILKFVRKVNMHKSVPNILNIFFLYLLLLCRCLLPVKKCQEGVGIRVICILIWQQFMSVLEELKGGKAP